MKKEEDERIEDFIYRHRNAEGEELENFVEKILEIYKENGKYKKVIDNDIHLLSLIYEKFKEANNQMAEHFKERCVDKIIEEIKEEREIKYPLQLMFLIENYEEEALDEIFNYLKPSDRNIIMIKIVSNSLNNHELTKKLKTTYHNLRIKKLTYSLFGKKIGDFIAKYL